MLLCRAMRPHKWSLHLPLFLLCVVISCTGIPRVFTLPTSAMEPTILLEEKFSADMTRFQPLYGELIIFEHEGLLLVKRTIGVSGDVLEGRNLQVFLNGKLLDEPYVQHIGKHPLVPKSLENFGPISIPTGKLFVAGDNRDFSLDSRDPSFGLISVSDIRGRPIEILHSPKPGRVHTILH